MLIECPLGSSQLRFARHGGTVSWFASLREPQSRLALRREAPTSSDIWVLRRVIEPNEPRGSLEENHFPSSEDKTPFSVLCCALWDVGGRTTLYHAFLASRASLIVG
jgi:hypothetical protein